ncbi:MAG TPA: NUDIX domain-containing protein [Anaerolineales bacterium]|nr:NUDIX domain-containing protein [Anaerolineales bacterium]
MMRLIYLAYNFVSFFIRPITLGARVMMIRNREVLLVRQTYLDGWFMPGGGLKRGETPEQAARREAREEVGAEVGELSLIGIYTHFENSRNDHIALFLCKDFELREKKDREIAETRFFSLDALPEGLVPGHRQRIENYRDGVETPRVGIW